VPAFQSAGRKALCWLPILLWTSLWTSGLTAQSCLVLSPATASPSGVALLNLSLYSSPGTAPAAVQWTFQYAPSNIRSLTVDDGPVLTAAGKTTMCSGNWDAYNCLVVGFNSNVIASGVIAKVTAVLAPSATTAVISIARSLASSAAGNLIPISPKITSAAGSHVSLDCRMHPPLKGADSGK
jgi:hypothetical protein